MPNHWHLVLWPREDGDLSQFVRWLTVTHTQRRHAILGTAGNGHVYQGRFKSFPVQRRRPSATERAAGQAGHFVRFGTGPTGGNDRGRGQGAAPGRFQEGPSFHGDFLAVLARHFTKVLF